MPIKDEIEDYIKNNLSIELKVEHNFHSWLDDYPTKELHVRVLLNNKVVAKQYIEVALLTCRK